MEKFKKLSRAEMKNVKGADQKCVDECPDPFTCPENKPCQFYVCGSVSVLRCGAPGTGQ